MAAAKDTEIDGVELIEKLRRLQDMRKCMVYQKATAAVSLLAEWKRKELNALGTLGIVAGSSITGEKAVYLVEISIVSIITVILIFVGVVYYIEGKMGSI